VLRGGGSLQWHLIAPEYPPDPGGVGDYTCLVAARLAEAGDDVHVWCPGMPDAPRPVSGATVHAERNRFTASDLRRVGQQLDRFPAPRRILVQWVPHGYGYRSMNLPLCLWLWGRSRCSGDRVELMVHEPFLAFGEGSWRQNIPALVHRAMTMILLRAAQQVWVSIPQWKERWRPYALGRRVPFEWLPIPSNIGVVGRPSGVQAVRGSFAPCGELLIGHFGTYGPPVAAVLEPLLLRLAGELKDRAVLLMGFGSDAFRERIVGLRPEAGSRIHATGPLAPEDLSCHLAACDLLVQPYPDGVSSRRTSLMAALSHGRPVVATEGRLTEPFWGGTRAVALAPVGDVQRFLELLRQLSSDAGHRRRMGQAARRLYQERFDISHTIAGLRRQAVFPKQLSCAS
jgi:glycosyltransferase involved in cell wall biosynthesis